MPHPEFGSAERLPAYSIGCVDRALTLLGMLGSQSEVRVVDAARELRVATSTAHRLLAMLVYRGFMVQDPRSRAYRAGPVLVGTGLAVLERVDLRRIGHPFLTRLAFETKETATMLVLHGRTARFVDGVDSPQQVRVTFRQGLTRPAQATSGGKALLAALPDETVQALFPDEDLPTLTGHTMRAKSQLLAEIGDIRRRGFAVNAQESAEGVVAVGVVVRDPYRRAVAAVNVAMPSSRINDPRLHHAARCAHRAAHEIGKSLYRLDDLRPPVGVPQDSRTADL